jgi:hypothetical protein
MNHVKRVGRLVLVVGGVLFSAAVAGARVTDVQAEVSVSLTRLDNGVAGDPNEATAAYPDPNDALPLQVIVRDVNPDSEAAAVVAAQFADPRVDDGIDPNEFALDLSLNTLTEEIRYSASATLVETRTVQFGVGTLPRVPGQPAEVDGLLTLDGVLAVFADDDVTDLTGNTVRLAVLIEQLDEPNVPTVLVDEYIELAGDPDTMVQQTASEGFPTGGLTRQDLADIDPDLGVFEALVFPALKVPFVYRVRTGQAFDLRVTLTVTASNAGEAAGVTALLGTPLESLAAVIGSTGGNNQARAMNTALAAARVDALQAAQADRLGPLGSFIPLCGMVGFELLLVPLVIVGFRVAPKRRMLPRE